MVRNNPYTNNQTSKTTSHRMIITNDFSYIQSPVTIRLHHILKLPNKQPPDISHHLPTNLNTQIIIIIVNASFGVGGCCGGDGWILVDLVVVVVEVEVGVGVGGVRVLGLGLI